MANNFTTQLTLYVGDLHPDVSEATLFEKFSAAGPITSIRVCRDITTRQSLGYAYVNFQQPADAERALDTMNYDIVRGRPIRIMFSQRDPAFRRSGNGNTFIKNLDPSIDSKSLHDTFSAFGNILSCKIMFDANGASKGFGFVHFEKEESSKTAIEKVNGMLLAGKEVYVGPFVPRAQRAEAVARSPFTNLFIKNFEKQLDDAGLIALFERFGKIRSAVVAKDANGESKGFGFCNFEEHEAATAAIDELNNTMIGEKKVTVCRFIPKKVRLQMFEFEKQKRRMENMKKTQGVNLYIKNLDDSITDEKLREEFLKFGNITSAKVMTDMNKKSKGFGFVCFTAADEATKAVTEMNGCIVGSKPLYVALAQRKDERRALLANQYYPRFNPQLPYPMSSPYQTTMVPYVRHQPIRQPYNMPHHMNYQSTPRWPMNSGNPAVRGSMSQGAFNSAPAYQGMLNPPRYPSANQGHNIRPTANQMNRHLVAQNQPMINTVMRPYATNAQAAYMSTARNLPSNNSKSSPAAITIGAQEPLTAAALANASIQQQKQMLGERLYELIYPTHSELAGKITGMLLEIDNTELLHMLESRELLSNKVEEAISVLRVHQTKQQLAAQQAVTNSTTP